MTANQLTTAAAFGLAGFALWYVFKTPGRTVAASTAQQQRDAGLASFLTNYHGQARELELSYGFNLTTLNRALGK